MNRLAGAIAAGRWRLLALVGGRAFLAPPLVGLPFLVDLVSRESEWIFSFLPNFQRSWEALL
jgi:hypothetical protein